MTWHLAPEALSRYSGGTADVALAASVETHVLACAECRRALNSYADAPALDAVWSDVVERLDAPRRSPLERVLVRCGLGDGEARLAAATPALRLSWLSAIAFTLLVAVLSTDAGAADVRAFLGLVPLVPVAGIATAYGRGVDPIFEIAAAAPYSLVRLLLLRVVTVLVASGLLISLSVLALPTTSWSPLVVVVPALALTMLSLLLATALAPPTAATVVAIGWLTTVAATRRRIPVEALTGSTGQLVLAGLALAAALLLLTRRNSIDLGSSA